ncbi:formimidoylglutamate deiminase [Thermogemmatispora tikiterensis]|uniref:Formimidoylglutamate deiminase n=1 Tax=Thermogemmatispora tikiterensis TaxID=1825093 RepID=A0A328VB74_9CHLR|nr:formimidoylglutamate deiminase [Thermogemmatispora tikiterensis]RAQ94898.1 formimidoylglutamate deiminase [Thermogemmatispora tikiterensis]
MRYLWPDYVYTSRGWQRDLLVALGEDGRIAGLQPRFADGVAFTLPEGAVLEPLPGKALLPGFVNVHSHVFQRALRGQAQRPVSGRDTFWSWRQAMYAEAQRLDPERLYTLARATYREMLAAGYTTVGEFHYVHHQPDGQPYSPPNLMAEALLQAAREAGIRLVILLAAYARNDFGQPALKEQRRFCDSSVAAYLERVEALRSQGASVGLAPHSVRAVPEDWLRAIAVYSRQERLPLHIHADEQLAEIESCLAACGCRPLELLARCEVLGPLTTVIHATHADQQELALLASSQASVCLCPTTEGDLGDGIPPYRDFLTQGIPLAIGSDSNTRLDPFEELRWAEYTARLRYGERRVLVAESETSPGAYLLACGCEHGAAALGLESGRLEPGRLADLVAIDLEHPMLQGWTVESLLDSLFFGASAEVVSAVWVAGRQVYCR